MITALKIIVFIAVYAAFVRAVTFLAGFNQFTDRENDNEEY